MKIKRRKTVAAGSLTAGYAACTQGVNAIALGTGACALTNQISLKLEGIYAPITIKLSPKAHAEFKKKILIELRKIYDLEKRC